MNLVSACGIDAALVVDGSSSTQSYVVLTRNKRLGTHICLKPMFWRENEAVVVIGGKFRVAFTPEGKEPPNDYEARVALMGKTAPHVKFARASGHRLRSMVGITYAASVYDGEQFFEKVTPRKFVNQLLAQLESNGDIVVPEKDLPNVKAALVKAFDHLFQNAKQGHGPFAPLPKTVQLPSAGKSGGLYNEGNPELVQSNVVDFTAKLKSKLEAQAAG